MPNEKIDNILNIEPQIVKNNNQDIVLSQQKQAVEENKSSLDSDFEEVRKNIKTLINQSKDVLDSMVNVAKETDSARAYEVVSDLLKTNFEANQKLLELHKKVKDIKQDNTVKGGDKVTNNAIFVGNTTELLKMIKDKKNILPDIKKIESVLTEPEKEISVEGKINEQ